MTSTFISLESLFRLTKEVFLFLLSLIFFKVFVVFVMQIRMEYSLLHFHVLSSCKLSVLFLYGRVLRSICTHDLGQDSPIQED